MTRDPRELAVLALLLLLLGCTRPADERLPSPLWREEMTGMQFVLIPAGRSLMGSPPDEIGREAREIQNPVRISRPSYLGRSEVTQDQWRATMGRYPCRFAGCGDDRPVQEVSCEEAKQFPSRLSEPSGEVLRLPTEAEWEYAFRAGGTTAFHFGGTLSGDQANYDGDPAMPSSPSGLDRARTMPVGSFPANTWGLHDMHGNGRELCEDRYCPCPSDEVADPLGECDSDLRVIRVGSWHFGADSARCALRYTHHPAERGPSLGFRVVWKLSPFDRTRSPPPSAPTSTVIEGDE